ncbi:right-handed parallel beta-helix repeat-containing protein [Pedobacter sp. PAMC26386]|nr:right-handed parallel beta-helix repeat-containing protein [Pedobacter sp. PAMC26386]
MKNLIYAVFLLLIFSSCAKVNNTDKGFKPDGATATNFVMTNYYVNGSSGNDANTGTTDATSLKTIQAALNKTVNGAGSTIYVAGGTYKERLSWPNSGASATEPIKLTSYNNGIVILDGVNATNDAQGAMISVVSKSHIRIEFIQIANNIRNFASGFNMSGSGTDVQITDCKIYNIGWTTDIGIKPKPGDNANPFVIIGNTASSYNQIYIGNNEVYSCNTGYSEGLTVGGNVENFLIEGNTVHDITNIGIDMTGNYAWTGAPANVNFARNGNVKYNKVYRCVSPVATSAGIYVDGGKWINIEGNRSYENSTGISVGCENNNFTADGINIRSNFIYNNVEAGIIMGANAANSKVVNSSITNNTLYKNYTKGTWGGEIHLQNTDGLSIKNNIIHSASNIVIVASSTFHSPNLTADYNNYYSASGTAATVTFDWGGINGTTYGSFAAYKTATGLDSNSTYSNPLYVSGTLPLPDLHLTSASLCVNKGLPSFVAQPGELDIDKEARVRNSRVDIGADETIY